MSKSEEVSSSSADIARTGSLPVLTSAQCKSEDPRWDQASYCLHQAEYHDLGEFVDAAREELSSLRARVAELEGELKSQTAQKVVANVEWSVMRGQLEACAEALSTATSEVERLRAGLEPFARYLDALENMGGSTPREGVIFAAETSVSGRREITVEDFKAARSALTQEGE